MTASASSARRMAGPFDWLLLATLGVIWGASFLGVELALTGFPPILIATGRVTMAAVVLVAVAVIFGDGLPKFKTATDRRIWLHCLGMGFFTNALPFSLLSWGQQLVTSGFAGISMAVVPLFVLPLAHLLVPGETMSRARTAGFVTGFIGVVLLVGGERIFGGAASGGDLVLAQLACVLASVCYAMGSIITRLCPPVSSLSYAAAGLLLGSVMLIPTALMTTTWPEATSGLMTAPLADVQLAAIPGLAWGGLIYLALFPTALATILLTMVINRAGPSFLSLVNYQVPVWAVVIGAVVLNEALPGHFITALAVILAGMAISQYYDHWRQQGR